MKKVNLLVTLLSIVCVSLKAQNFKQIVPNENPFKSFEVPVFKFDCLTFKTNKNYFLETENKVFAKNDLMPIKKYKGNEREMLIMEPNKNIEFKMLVKKIDLKMEER